MLPHTLYYIIILPSAHVHLVSPVMDRTPYITSLFSLPLMFTWSHLSWTAHLILHHYSPFHSCSPGLTCHGPHTLYYIIILPSAHVHLVSPVMDRTPYITSLFSLPLMFTWSHLSWTTHLILHHYSPFRSYSPGLTCHGPHTLYYIIILPSAHVHLVSPIMDRTPYITSLFSLPLMFTWSHLSWTAHLYYCPIAGLNHVCLFFVYILILNFEPTDRATCRFIELPQSQLKTFPACLNPLQR